MGTQIFNTLVEKAYKYFKYEAEFQYGPFESGPERWKAIIAVKEMLVKNGYTLQEKKKK